MCPCGAVYEIKSRLVAHMATHSKPKKPKAIRPGIGCWCGSTLKSRKTHKDHLKRHAARGEVQRATRTPTPAAVPGETPQSDLHDSDTDDELQNDAAVMPPPTDARQINRYASRPLTKLLSATDMLQQHQHSHATPSRVLQPSVVQLRRQAISLLSLLQGWLLPDAPRLGESPHEEAPRDDRKGELGIPSPSTNR